MIPHTESYRFYFGSIALGKKGVSTAGWQQERRASLAVSTNSRGAPRPAEQPFAVIAQYANQISFISPRCGGGGILLLDDRSLLAVIADNNDPSAGSPTETLLRLLLPLNDQVRSSSRTPHARRSRMAASARMTSLNHSIGSSDGRCVQRAGT